MKNLRIEERLACVSERDVEVEVADEVTSGWAAVRLDCTN